MAVVVLQEVASVVIASLAKATAIVSVARNAIVLRAKVARKQLFARFLKPRTVRFEVDWLEAKYGHNTRKSVMLASSRLLRSEEDAFLLVSGSYNREAN